MSPTGERPSRRLTFSRPRHRPTTCARAPPRDPSRAFAWRSHRPRRNRRRRCRTRPWASIATCRRRIRGERASSREP